MQSLMKLIPKCGVWFTGDKKELYKQARQRLFCLQPCRGDGGPSDFIHEQKFILIDKSRRIRGLL